MANKTPAQGSWLRKPDDDAKKASFPELFFDLVFVFALIQLSHTLASDFSSTAVFEAAILILAIWWVWIDTTWVTNLLDAEREPVRLMLFAMMFCGVLLAIALPGAFSDYGLIFAGIYCAMQIGRSLFAAYAFHGIDNASYRTFVRITAWLFISSLLWIAGGFVELEWRIALWSVALLVEYVSPAFGYYVPGLGKSPAETLNISGEHMAERCALFVIICLGETVLTTGRNAAEHMNADMTFVVLCGAFLSTVIMWWIYFHHGQEVASDKAASTANPESVAQNIFTYGHLPIVAGIILTAVGEDFSLSHAEENASVKYAGAILGGPILFLAGNLWVKMVSSKMLPVSHIAGIILLGMIALCVPITQNVVLQLLATTALLSVALWEYIALRKATVTTA